MSHKQNDHYSESIAEGMEGMNAQTKQTHTPTPWEFGGGAFITPNGKTERFIRSKSGIVAFCEGELKQAQTNAQFIVKAVNSHDELIETLKLTLTELTIGEIAGHLSKNPYAYKIVKDIEQALKKVGAL